MRRFIISAFALLLLSTASACGVGDDEVVAGSEDELRAMTITDADEGKTFAVEKGRTFKVSLSANPTTGYQWTVVRSPSAFGYPTPAEGKYERSPTGAIGVGGRQVFTWKTSSLPPMSRAGSVKLEYRRPFEGDSEPPARTFTFKIKVTDAEAPPPEDATPDVPPLVLFEEHDGTQVRAAEGQAVVVRLPENASTGYAWYVVADGALAAPESTRETYGSRPGASATRVLTWETAGKLGSHSIRLKSSRGSSGAASKTFSVIVNVVAEGDEYSCPPTASVNCMPPTTSPYCAADYRSWAEESCDVSFLF